VRLRRERYQVPDDASPPSLLVMVAPFIVIVAAVTGLLTNGVLHALGGIVSIVGLVYIAAAGARMRRRDHGRGEKHS
jgi:hypothetical protein